MLFITKETEAKKPTKEGIQLFYFYDAHTVFHQKMMLVLEKLENVFPTLQYFAVDLGIFPERARVHSDFTIKGLPQICVRVHTRIRARVEGPISFIALKAIVADIYSTETKLQGDQL